MLFGISGNIRKVRALAVVLAIGFQAVLAAGPLRILARDTAGHGLLCRLGSKTVLMVSGTPEQMGAAQGRLLTPQVRGLTTRVMYLVGAGYSVSKNDWFFERIGEVMKRALPYTPERFIRECRALAAAAGISERETLASNFFPEMFHCSGFAVCGSATRDGRLLHARVLDYMRDLGLQNFAVVQVYLPEHHFAWMSLGYAGFVGTVTAMNEKGLAIGEMGGRGEGDWDGVPMNLLLRDVMERAATVQEAIHIIKNTPRTCEYYYVVSDRNRDMAGLCCTPEKVELLLPGAQHDRLPHVPPETVMISGGSRARHLSERLTRLAGRIDVAAMIDIIKRPVAMRSNLHDAVFRPETLDMWFSDAGKTTPACDEPYAHVNLGELLAFYRRNCNAAAAAAK